MMKGRTEKRRMKEEMLNGILNDKNIFCGAVKGKI